MNQVMVCLVFKSKNSFSFKILLGSQLTKQDMASKDPLLLDNIVLKFHVRNIQGLLKLEAMPYDHLSLLKIYQSIFNKHFSILVP